MPEPLCLEFANTAGFHALEGRPERLVSFPALLGWARDAGVLTRHEAARLQAATEDQAAAVTLQKALSLRDAVQSLFSRIARNRAPSPASLDTINEALSAAMGHVRIVPSEARQYALGWERSDSPERLIWPIAWSAAELLRSPLLAGMRECAGRDCSRLFIDRSRNGTRRWCSMSGCGNRAKARRHYRRARQ